MSPRSDSRARAAGAVALCLSLSSCVIVEALDVVEVPESNDWNLSQLHKPSGSYSYTADLAGDLEYVLRSGRNSLPFKTDPERLLGNKKEAIENPAEETLDNLIDLKQFDRDEEWTAGLQSMWYCRLAVDDPSMLARERCVIELGYLGERLAIGTPVPLPPDAVPAGPAELGGPLTDLIRRYRLYIEGGARDADQLAELDESCQAVESLVLDLQAGRRVLFVANLLLRPLGAKHAARPPLERLSRSTQTRLIEQALAAALADREPLVRAAAIEACVKASGRAVLAAVLLQLDREPSNLVAVRVMDLVREHGLPDAPAEMDPAMYADVREGWLQRIYSLAVNHPEGHVRVHAMRALGAVVEPSVGSLREEDWERWWTTRRAAPAGAGAPERGT